MPRRFFQFESFRVDVTERQLWRGPTPVPLTPKVFDMLLVLLENRGQTVEKEQLIRQVWADTYVEEGSINRNISTLRKALGDDKNEQRLIKTLPKRGYRFTDNVEEIIDDERSIPPSLKAPEPIALKPANPTKRSFANVVLALVAVSGVGLAIAWAVGKREIDPADLKGLTANEIRRLTASGSANSDAIENYLKGRSLWRDRSAEGLHQSIIHLEHAVNADPNFALAHAALADAYAFDAQKRTIAKEQAQKAIALDETLGEPHATIGFVEMFWEWKLEAAGESFKKAIELSPEYATAHQWYAINLVTRRSGGAALAEMKRAAELEPDSLAISADLCQMYYFLRKHDDALEQCGKTLAADPKFLNAHIYLYDVYSAKQMYDESVNSFFRSEQLKSDFAIPFEDAESFRKAYANGGIEEFWKARVAYLERNPNAYKLAQYFARQGQNQKAIDWLERSRADRNFDFIYVFADPVFKVLESEPRFIELAAALSEVQP